MRFLPASWWPTMKITKLYDTKMLILVRNRLTLILLIGGSDVRKLRSMQDFGVKVFANFSR